MNADNFMIAIAEYLSGNDLPFTVDEYLMIVKKARREIITKLDFALKNGYIDEKQRDIIYRRQIDWNSLLDVGRHYGVTRERIRQIEAKAMEILRQLDMGNYQINRKN